MKKKKILIINSGCLRVNCSANLCHIAYIKGFVETGADVTVLSKSVDGQVVDDSLVLPTNVKYIEIKGSRIAAKFGSGIKTSIGSDDCNQSSVHKRIIKWIVQKIIDLVYGEMGVSQAWINNAVRKFKTSEKYDLVLSLSGPVSSHLAGVELVKKRRIMCDCFCELWEDPWQYDLFNLKVDKKKLALEEKMTTYADCVIYVSPITLNNQKSMFTSSASKMTWLPLPYYYKTEQEEAFDHFSYGYFGDYYPNSRNILPFYEAADRMGLNVNICGNPSGLIESKNNIHVHPRLKLEELSKYENDTNVLVFVCNLSGGQIPGKIYQYAATRKKILFILDGKDEEKEVLREYFAKFNRFYFCDNNVESIEKTIKLLELDEGVQCEPVEYFSPKRIVTEIIKKCNLEI